MITKEMLDQMADQVNDSSCTKPSDILFFSPATIGQSLKKLKNHNFKIGYVYSIELEDQIYTRIVAYNHKNDIVRIWLGNQNDQLYMPIKKSHFISDLTAVRITDIDGAKKLKVFKEDFNYAKRQHPYSRNQFRYLQSVEVVDDVDLYGHYWPVLECSKIEELKQNLLLTDQDVDGFYSEAAYLCNIYNFDFTYTLLDDGLKKIYQTLAENKDELFCKNIIAKNEINVVKKVLSFLNLTWQDLEEVFDNQGLKLPDFTYKPIKQKIHKNPLRFFMD